MTSEPRRAQVAAFAKINLGLRVLYKRPDGYHELRTVYQTISLADTLDVEFAPARRTSVEVNSQPEIPGNLVERAARLAMDAMRVTGRVSLRLKKKIPMGAGLGGGSSDAAAVLLALPALARRPLSLDMLIRLAGELGSDVPLFLLGGTTLGLGRGSEVYPLPDLPRTRGLLVAPDLHVSTSEAYRALGRASLTETWGGRPRPRRAPRPGLADEGVGRGPGGPPHPAGLTNDAAGNMINSFQSCVWLAGVGVSTGIQSAHSGNDFEVPVFRQHPRLRSIKTRLRRVGAEPAMLTGSGSALFGIFRSREELEAALPHFQKEQVFPFVFVSRASYRARWRRCLGSLVDEEIWPPKSRDPN